MRTKNLNLAHDLMGAAEKAITCQGLTVDGAHNIAERLVKTALIDVEQKYRTSLRPPVRCRHCGFWCEVHNQQISTWQPERDDFARCLNPVCECSTIALRLSTYRQRDMDVLVSSIRNSNFRRSSERDTGLHYAELIVRTWEFFEPARRRHVGLSINSDPA